MDWRDFSLWCLKVECAGGSSGTQLKDILLAIPPDAIHAKQQALRRVRDKMVLPPQQSRMNGKVLLIGVRFFAQRGDAFEMVLLALREKARARKVGSFNGWVGFSGREFHACNNFIHTHMIKMLFTQSSFVLSTLVRINHSFVSSD